MSKLILPRNHEPAYGVVTFLAFEKDGLVLVVDMWNDLTPDAKRDTSKVTDAPQVVITELLKRGYPVNDRVLLYLDENGIWDRILVHNGSFDNFQVLHADSYQKALSQLLAAGVISAKDTRKENVVDKAFRL